MKVTISEEPAWTRVLSITVEPDVVGRETDRILDGLRRRLNLPGFRKGKVPKEIARKVLGSELDGEVLQAVIPRALEDALREHEIRPLGEPRISDLNFEPGEPLSFKATVEILPRLTIEGYRGLKVTREVPEVDEEDVNRTLDALRESRAVPETVERPAKTGDLVSIGYQELDAAGDPKEEEPQEMVLELGGERTPESFTEALLGVVAGETKEVPLPYPADFPDPELAGTTRRFRVTASQVQERVWPPLDDALAQAALDKEAADVNMLREQIRLNHEAEAEKHAHRMLADKILKRILELNPFDLPRGMVEDALGRVVAQARKENQNLSEDEIERLRENYRPAIEGRFRTDLVVDTLAAQEEIQVTDEDLDKQITSFAERGDDPPAKIKARLKKEGGFERLRDDLLRRRVVDRLVELADVTEVKVRPQDKEHV